MTNSYISTKDSVTVFVNGKIRTIRIEDSNYSLVIEGIKEKDWTKVEQNLDMKHQIESKFSSDGVEVKGSEVFYNGSVIHNVLTEKMITMLKDGFDFKPLANFLNNLMKNPSKTAIDELYLFLETNDLPITEDGHFLAYKAVRKDYMDHYSGTFDNTPGKPPISMPRNTVDDNRQVTCSKGLHFCSKSYLENYSLATSNYIILKINPKNVVSIPCDYNNAKGRCCEYFVLQDYVEANPNLSKVVYEDKDDFNDNVRNRFADEFDYGDDDADDSCANMYGVKMTVDEPFDGGTFETASTKVVVGSAYRAKVNKMIYVVLEMVQTGPYAGKAKIQYQHNNVVNFKNIENVLKDTFITKPKPAFQKQTNVSTQKVNSLDEDIQKRAEALKKAKEKNEK